MTSPQRNTASTAAGRLNRVRIGLFGGTFNPIHIGHVALAENVAEGLNLDIMYLIPAKVPPHKTEGIIAPELRLKMTELVASMIGDKFVVSDFEINAEGTSYTLKTLRHFREQYPDDELFFACGTDIFATIETWHEYMKLFDYSNFVIVSRSMMSFDDLLKTIPQNLLDRVVSAEEFQGEKFGKAILYRMPEVDISSTEIRDIVEESYRKANLPDGIYDYIEENRLYRGDK